MAIKTFAAIDIGSFELVMSVYELSARHGIHEVEHVRHVITLGRDTYSQGKISYEHIDELCRKLTDFTQIMAVYRVEEYRAYATSAIREAQNNQIVLDQIHVKTGIKVQILSNSEERLLGYKAIASKEQEFNRIIQKGTAIVDVGFGSTQISLFDKDSLVSTQNLKLGTLRIHELLSQMHSDSTQVNEIIQEMADLEVTTFKKMYLKEHEVKNVIGTGEGLRYFLNFLRNREDHSMKSDRLTTSEFMSLYERLLLLSHDDIEEAFDIPARYIPLLMPSIIVYRQMLQITGAEMVWVPGVRLCDGIVAAYAHDKKILLLKHDFAEDILMASRNIAKRYQYNRRSCQVLESNVLKIFDSMKKYHGLGKRERLLLQIAAILQDCGKYISIKRHSSCSYNIIMSTEIIGLSHREREIVANVVRYATDDNFYYERTEGRLDKDFYLVIIKLTAILMAGRALDRSGRQKLRGIKTMIRDAMLIITADTAMDISLEKGALLEKAGFFEEVYGIRPVLKQKRGI